MGQGKSVRKWELRNLPKQRDKQVAFIRSRNMKMSIESVREVSAKGGGLNSEIEGGPKLLAHNFSTFQHKLFSVLNFG